MKKIALYIAVAALAMTGCQGLLDTENYTESNTANFPSTFEDAQMLVTNIYANFNHMTSYPEHSFLIVSEIASDDRFGGNAHDMDHIMVGSESDFDSNWSGHYTGIYAANTALEGLQRMADKVTDTKLLNQLLGESYFLRAYYYHELAEMFGPVPLITSTTQDTNAPRASEEELYGQMGSDLKNAISLMASDPYNAYMESGHATKWAAEALLARIFLFYTGFYQKDSMPCTDAAAITKADVIGYLEDCIQNSGHDLVGDFRNLWAYTNKYTVGDYAYTTDASGNVLTGVDGQPLNWAGNGNKEEVFAIKYCNYYYGVPGDDRTRGYSNFYIPFFGMWSINGNGTNFPFGNGNGWGTVATNLWEEWAVSEPGDLRREASIAEIATECPDYYSTGDTGQWEDTGYWGKKMMPILAKEEVTGQKGANSLFWAAWDGFDRVFNDITNWGGHFNDLVVIRFADVLLMHSELKEDAEGLNRVRARVGLSPVGYSLDNIQKERRHELAFEGTRWADIRRWHIAPEALSAQNGVAMENAGRATVMRDGRYAERYNATQGFFPIPQAQIRLSKGVLTQNDGWGAEGRYTTWDFD